MTDPQPDAPMEGVAIIGMAGRFPGAPGIEALWDLLHAGREGIRVLSDEELAADDYQFPALREDPRYVRSRGIVDGVEFFDAAFFGMSPREAATMDPQQRLWLECAWEALERSGYPPGRGEPNTGVFAGTFMSTYLLHNLLGTRERTEEFLLGRGSGDYATMLNNEKDSLATRTSFRFDLRGPSETIQTACSTSLVAINRACQSLLQYETEMCLAGGVSLTLPQKQGYQFQEGAILSPDGHCRPFDHRAKGTVPAEGVAVVVLKRLEDALRDGDHIHAVIRGSAVNNDGSRKVGFTAPSPEGQAAVISMALALAGVDPGTIGYVEAHGTATPLGDPIEVQGLTRAFRGGTDRTGFCGLGSLKGNLGHLDAAAGAAGLIKAALVLEHELIPPTLHYERANPEIRFEETPFFVVDRPLPWPRGGAPRRAGVSSFGIGGTNAHAVLEEAPDRAPSGPSRPMQLVTLSARTPEALEVATTRLALHLREHPEQPLSDVAYTLAVGRAEFPHRRIAVVREGSDAARALEDREPTRVAHGVADGAARPLVFMFPGQGSQHVNMAADLYRIERGFRDRFDAGAEVLQPILGLDIRDLVYPPDGREEWAAEALRQTAVTQPVLFVVQYALAELFASWGMSPDAMIGHSVGEYTAAAISGVFTFEDALGVLSRRARLMQERPPGGMLAVRLPAGELETRLGAPLALAAINAPRLSVVSGPNEALAAFRDALEAEGVRTTPLHTSHAYHSSMMDEALEPFEAAVSAVQRRPPSVPWISSLTGTWISREEAESPGYWARQLRGTVRFSPGILELQREAGRVFLEVGPGTTLATFVQQHPDPAARRAVLSSLPHAQSEASALESVLVALGRMWALGIAPDWNRFYAGEERRRVILPTYPFERKRHWVDAPSTGATARAAASPVPHAEVNVIQVAATPAAHTSPTPPSPGGGGGVPAAFMDRVIAILGELWGEPLEDDQVDLSFLEIGFDSLVLAQVSARFESEFSVPLRFRQLFDEIPTPRRLAVYLAENLPREASDRSAPSTVTGPTPADSTPIPSANGSPTPAEPGAVGAHLPAFPVPAPTAGSDALDRLIEGQLAVMRQQLELLRLMGREGAETAVESGNVASSGARTVTIPAPAPGEGGVASSQGSGDGSRPEPAAPERPFGASARIQLTRSGQLDSRQEEWLRAFTERYVARTAASRHFTEKNRPLLADPRVVSGFSPQLKELVYPIVVERARGSRVWDLDGNEYLDMVSGFGSILLGHGHPLVTEAVTRCLEDGFAVGPQHPLTGEVASLMLELTGLPRTAFCTTGSEAVLAAIRAARTATGRTGIAMFRDSYHGLFDEVAVRGRREKALPAASGIPASAVSEVLLLDYGEPESLRILEERMGSLAAVLVEPVQSRNLDLQPREFVRELRRLTEAQGTALIFDEMVTGFRVGPGGAQAYFGVKADLATYGKVVGGGLPVGLVAGTPRFMDTLDGGPWSFGDDSYPAVGVTYFAGTHVRHPMVLAATAATLRYLKEQGSALPARITELATGCVQRLRDLVGELGVPLQIQHFSSAFQVVFTEPTPLGGLLLPLLREQGIHIFEGRTWFFTAAHEDGDVDRIVEAFRHALGEMVEHGFLARVGAGDRRTATGVAEVEEGGASTPTGTLAGPVGLAPAPDARLGRDPQGKPGWYRPDPDRPGRYVRVKDAAPS